jgi:flagellar biosynthesis protein FlhF
MRIKIFKARNVAEAMAMVRREMGEEALIIDTRALAGGVEIRAALEEKEEEKGELPAGPGRERQILAYHGVPEALLDAWELTDLPCALERYLRFSPLPLQEEGNPVAFIGPPGTGKTLTVAKIATRLVLERRPPLVITADTRRAGAVEQLAAYTRLLGINLFVASQPSAILRALARRQQGEPVLIDTCGIDPFLKEDREQLTDLLAAAGAEPIAVLSATLGVEQAASWAMALAELGARHFVPTQLDLTRRLGALIMAAFAGGFRIAEAGIGMNAADGLVLLTPQELAGRLRAGFEEKSPAGPVFDFQKKVHFA